VIPFARLLAAGCPPQGGLALALAAEFHAADLEAAEAALGELSDGMAPARGLPAHEQLAHCARETAARLVARVRPGAVEDLLLDRVLAQGVGDPVCWAIACVQAARRAGIPLGIVADEDEHVLVAHRQLETRLVVEPQSPDVPIDAGRLPAGELTWRCAHETALMLLDRIVTRASRTGRMHDALRAAELRLELPLDDATLALLREEREGIAARLN
jgi:hypothetical protein